MLEPISFAMPNILAQMLVVQNYNVAHVEGVLELVFGNGHREARPKSITNPQFISCVYVICGEISNDEVCIIEPLVHWLVDRAGIDNFVGSHTSEARFLHGFSDHLIRSI